MAVERFQDKVRVSHAVIVGKKIPNKDTGNVNPSAEARARGREDRVAEERREFRGVTRKGHAGGSKARL